MCDSKSNNSGNRNAGEQLVSDEEVCCFRVHIWKLNCMRHPICTRFSSNFKLPINARNVCNRVENLQKKVATVMHKHSLNGWSCWKGPIAKVYKLYERLWYAHKCVWSPTLTQTNLHALVWRSVQKKNNIIQTNFSSHIIFQLVWK